MAMTRHVFLKSALLLPIVAENMLQASASHQTESVLHPPLVSETGIPAQGTGDHSFIEGVRAFIKKSEYPAVWVAAAKNGKLIGTACAGYCDITSSAPARLDNVLRIGSVSKPFVGTIIAVAVQQGAIRYEDTLYQICPGLRVAGKSVYSDVTLEMLLAHLAGFTADRRLAVQGTPKQSDFRALRWKEALSVVQTEPLSKPGTTYSYSNIGVELAAVMLEVKTGRTYEEWFHDVINDKLKLSTAGIGEVKDNGTSPYLLVKGKIVPAPAGIHWPYSYGPYGSVHCTIEDLVRFGLAHCQFASEGRLFPIAMLNDMHKQVLPSPATRSTFNRAEFPEGSLLTHGGSLTNNRGDSTMLWIRPEKGIVVAAFTNVSKRTEEAGTPPGDVLKNEIVRPLFNALIR